MGALFSKFKDDKQKRKRTIDEEEQQSSKRQRMESGGYEVYDDSCDDTTTVAESVGVQRAFADMKDYANSLCVDGNRRPGKEELAARLYDDLGNKYSMEDITAFVVKFYADDGRHDNASTDASTIETNAQDSLLGGSSPTQYEDPLRTVVGRHVSVHNRQQVVPESAATHQINNRSIDVTGAPTMPEHRDDDTAQDGNATSGSEETEQRDSDTSQDRTTNFGRRNAGTAQDGTANLARRPTGGRVLRNGRVISDPPPPQAAAIVLENNAQNVPVGNPPPEPARVNPGANHQPRAPNPPPEPARGNPGANHQPQAPPNPRPEPASGNPGANPQQQAPNPRPDPPAREVDSDDDSEEGK